MFKMRTTVRAFFLIYKRDAQAAEGLDGTGCAHVRHLEGRGAQVEASQKGKTYGPPRCVCVSPHSICSIYTTFSGSLLFVTEIRMKTVQARLLRIQYK